MMRMISALLLGCIAFACSSAPHVEEQKPEATVQAPAPTSSASPVQSGPAKRIEGRLIQDVNGLKLPVKSTTLKLMNSKGKIVREAISDSEGNFSFSGSFPYGAYHLKIVSPRFRGKKALKIESEKVSGVVLSALTMH